MHRSKLLCLTLFTVFFLTLAPGAAAAGSGIKLYYDGVELEGISPQTVNGRVLLPMRQLFELFGSGVHWDPLAKSIETNAGPTRIKLHLDSNIVLYKTPGSDVWSESSTDQPPVVINERVYVPLRFIATELNCVVEWFSSSNSVFISTPFRYVNGEWFKTRAMYWNTLYPNDTMREFDVLDTSGPGVWEFDGLIFACVEVGDSPTLSHTCLYALDSDGRSRLIESTMNGVYSVKAEGGSLYLLEGIWPFYTTTAIVKIDLDRPYIRARLGDASFSYGGFIRVAERENGSLELPPVGLHLDFQVREDGIYVIGYDTAATLSEGMATSVASLPLLAESYGYYLLPKDGAPHRLVENETLEVERDVIQ